MRTATRSLTRSRAGRPGRASTHSTGRLSGTPSGSNVGSFNNVLISVSDGIAISSLPAFSIRVDAANRAPAISGTPPTSVTAGQAYSFQPTASDADGDTLAFSITGRPSWASFNTQHRSPVRHADLRGNPRRDRDQRGRWPCHGRAAGVHDHRERAATGQSRTGDQRQPADIGARRSAHTTSGRRRATPTATRSASRLRTSRPGRVSTPPPVGSGARRTPPTLAPGAEYGSRSATAQRAHRSPASRSSWSRSRSAR